MSKKSSIEPIDLLKIIEIWQDVVFIDVREAEERINGYFLPNSIHIPFSKLKEEQFVIDDLNNLKKLHIIHCAKGIRAKIVADIQQKNDKLRYFAGDFKELFETNQAIEGKI